MAKTLLSRAVTLLHSDTYTCILCDRDRVLTSRSNGIAPLLTRIEDKEDLRGMVCADKIIGKAAAMLLLYSGVRAAHGDVMSVKAKNLLEQAGVPVLPTPSERTPEYYEKRPCERLIGEAAELLDRLLEEEAAR